MRRSSVRAPSACANGCGVTAADPAFDPRAIEALLAFWAEAGVDACLADAPIDRPAAPPPKAPSQPPSRAAEPKPLPARSPAPPARSQAAAAPDRGAEASATAAAAGDLDALVVAARAFFPGPSPAVVLDGPAPARLVVVGDAPSAEDEAEGRPFAGPRGALVRALLAAAGLGEGVLWINTVFRRTQGGSDPTAQAQALAAPFVARAVAITRPCAALLLGGCAVRGTTGDATPILKLRGGLLTWTPSGAAPLPALATLGPDFLLKHPAMKKQAWADVLSLAVRLAQMRSGG